MAIEVFGREATLGDDGFNGSGGGALSGSELSHLVLSVSNVQAQLLDSGACSLTWESRLFHSQSIRNVGASTASHSPVNCPSR